MKSRACFWIWYSHVLILRREFIINSVFLLLTNFLIRPVYILFIDMQVQNRVGPEEYGLYFLMYDFAFLFIALNDPGLQAYSSRVLASNKDNIPTLFSELAGLKITLGFVFIVVSFLIALFLGYNARQLQLLGLIAAGMVLSSSFILMRTVLTGLGAYRIDTFLSSLDRVLLIILLGSILYLGYFSDELTIEFFAGIQLFAYFLACMLIFLVLFKSKMIKWPSFNFKKMVHVLQSTLPFAGVILLTSICNRIDVVMINEMLPEKTALYQSGVYAAGYRFLDAANMVGFLFGSLLLPMFARMLAEKIDLKPLFQTGFGLLLMMSTLIGLSCVFYASNIFNIAYTDVYDQHSDIMYPLMLSLIPITLSNAFGPLIMAHGNLKKLNIALTAAIVLNVVLNLFVIPDYAALGTAYTTLITEIFLLICMFVIARRQTGISPENKLLRNGVLFVIIAAATIYLLTWVELPWMVEILIFGIIGLSLALLLNIIHPKGIQLIKDRRF